jgi:hypothetical protein
VPKKIKKIDREAMKLAIEMVRKRGGADKRQIEEMLRERPWEEVGDFAAGCCQERRLRTKPWQPTPSDDYIFRYYKQHLAKGPDGIMGRYRAAELVERMLKAGVSVYHPDPERALAEAEKERPATTGQTEVAMSPDATPPPS